MVKSTAREELEGQIDQAVRDWCMSGGLAVRLKPLLDAALAEARAEGYAEAAAKADKLLVRLQDAALNLCGWEHAEFQRIFNEEEWP